MPSSCPQNYSIVSNGCYYVGLHLLNWQSAHNTCTNLITPLDQANGVITHLVSIDSLAESISLNIYLKNLNLASSYWTDGIASQNLKKWEWYNATFLNYGYLKYSFNGTGNVQLQKNSSSDFEIHDSIVDQTKAYVCEAQGEKSIKEGSLNNI